jgi:tRNA G26 N,N-dimethylase Trm1
LAVISNPHYNAKQLFERDLSVLAIKAYGEHCLAVGRQKMEKINMKRKRGNEGATTTTTTHNSRESNIKPQAFMGNIVWPSEGRRWRR